MGGYPFYQWLHQILDMHAFDAFAKTQYALFYATPVGRPSLLPGTYFRLLLIAYFEGIDSERGIAWRTADLAGAQGLPELGPRRGVPRAFDPLADAAADRLGDASGDLHLWHLLSATTSSITSAWSSVTVATALRSLSYEVSDQTVGNW